MDCVIVPDRHPMASAATDVSYRELDDHVYDQLARRVRRSPVALLRVLLEMKQHGLLFNSLVDVALDHLHPHAWRALCRHCYMLQDVLSLSHDQLCDTFGAMAEESVLGRSGDVSDDASTASCEDEKPPTQRGATADQPARSASGISWEMKSADEAHDLKPACALGAEIGDLHDALHPAAVQA